MMITLFREAPDGGQRLYTISDQQLTLPGTWGFTAAWTVGGSWRERHRAFGSPGEMDKAVRTVIRRKLREGYRILYTFDARAASLDQAVQQGSRRAAR